MKRYLQESISKDLKRKMVMLSGPRQVGKTFIAKALCNEFSKPQYLNYDDPDDMLIIHGRTWRSDADLLVFDEIHKMQDWKSFLKGAGDSRPKGQAILVTGSARLDTFRQSGESLAGRYFPYHLHPLSVKELSGLMEPEKALIQLNLFGGFPEPFLSGSETEAARWRNQYYTDLIREDILEFSRIQEIRSMRLLLELLRKRVGSPLSHASLASDLKIAPNTLRSYLEILESLHIVFQLRPFHRNVARAIQKEPKVYFSDTGYVIGNDGTKLENTVAVSLRKHVDYIHEVTGGNVSLHYVRTKEKHEVDFALVKDDRVETLVEAKLSEHTVDPGLKYLVKALAPRAAFQVVQNLRQPQTIGDINIVNAAEWLSGLSA